jgi:hypothetical protein
VDATLRDGVRFTAAGWHEPELAREARMFEVGVLVALPGAWSAVGSHPASAVATTLPSGVTPRLFTWSLSRYCRHSLPSKARTPWNSGATHTVPLPSTAIGAS